MKFVDDDDDIMK